MGEESPEKLWIRPPDPFSFVPEKWEVWKHRYRRYLNVSGQAERPDEEKIDLMIYLMGERGEQIFNQFLIRPKTLDQLLKEFDKYFQPKRIGCSRFKFNRRVQADGETIENFVTDLQNLANDCDYGNMRDVLVRDRIIAGMKDEQLSERLQLEDSITLEETLKIINKMSQPKSLVPLNPVRSVYQSSYHLTVQGFQEVSSSTYENQRQLCVSETVPDNIFSGDEEMGAPVLAERGEGETELEDEEEEEEEEGQTVSLLYENFQENNSSSNSNNSTSGISTTEHETIIKLEEDIIDEELSNDAVNDTNNSDIIIESDNSDSVIDCDDIESISGSCSSIVLLYEKETDKTNNNMGIQMQPCIKQDTSDLLGHNSAQSRKALCSKQSANVFSTFSKKSLNDLDDACLLNIFNNLPISDLVRIERVCKKWQKISLKCWENIKNLDVKNEFRVEAIHLNVLEGLLRRCGDYVTSLNCSWLNKSPNLPAKNSIKIINKYCKRVHHLNICYTFKENNYLQYLDINLVKRLKILNIGSEKFSDDHLPVLLKNAVNLEQFVIAGYDDSHQNNLLNLSQKCKTLGITDTDKFSNDMLKEVLQNHPNIENLDISATNITPDALLPFKKQLKALGLWDMENFYEDLSVLKKLKCPNLTVLDLSFNDYEITGAVLIALIHNCPQIEDLRLRRCKDLDENDLYYLKKLKNLKYLDVSSSPITAGSIIQIAKASGKLKMLSCYGCCRIYEGGLAQIIAASPELTYLAIRHSIFTKSFVKYILPILQRRKNKTWLTISLRLKNPDKILEYVKNLGLEDEVDHTKSTKLRIVYGCPECNCSFERHCFCSELEEMLLCFP